MSGALKFQSQGIPKITGTADLFDAHPAIEASYNTIVGEIEHSETEESPPEDPPLLFSQFEQFLFLIQKYFLLCKVQCITTILGFGD